MLFKTIQIFGLGIFFFLLKFDLEKIQDFNYKTTFIINTTKVNSNTKRLKFFIM